MREVLCPAHTDTPCSNQAGAALTARRGLPRCPGNLPEHPPVRQPGAPSAPAAGSSARAHPGKSPPKHVSGVRLFRSTQGVKFTLFFVRMGDLAGPIGSYARTPMISQQNPNLPRVRQQHSPRCRECCPPAPGPHVLGCNCPGQRGRRSGRPCLPAACAHGGGTGAPAADLCTGYPQIRETPCKSNY